MTLLLLPLATLVHQGKIDRGEKQVSSLSSYLFSSAFCWLKTFYVGDLCVYTVLAVAENISSQRRTQKEIVIKHCYYFSGFPLLLLSWCCATLHFTSQNKVKYSGDTGFKDKEAF